MTFVVMRITITTDIMHLLAKHNTKQQNSRLLNIMNRKSKFSKQALTPKTNLNSNLRPEVKP